MKLHISAFITLSIIATCWSSSSAQTTPPLLDGNKVYDSLVLRAKAGDSTVNFLTLRLAYAHSDSYRPYPLGAVNWTDSLQQAYKAENFAEVIRYADTILATNFTDFDAHMARGAASLELGDSADYRFRDFIVTGLARSILATGNGESAKTAYQVISVSEEYTLTRLLGYAVTNQSLVHEGEHSVDLLDVVNKKSGKSSQLYFNVDIPMHWISVDPDMKKLRDVWNEIMDSGSTPTDSATK